LRVVIVGIDGVWVSGVAMNYGRVWQISRKRRRSSLMMRWWRRLVRACKRRLLWLLLVLKRVRRVNRRRVWWNSGLLLLLLGRIRRQRSWIGRILLAVVSITRIRVAIRVTSAVRKLVWRGD
jgi:hypothetical protein